MDLEPRDTLLTVGTAAAMLVGIVLILVESMMLTTVGIVLVTLSGLVFIVDAKDLLVRTDQNASE